MADGKFRAALYDGRCRRCGERVVKGQTVLVIGFGSGVACLRCVDPAAYVEPPRGIPSRVTRPAGRPRTYAELFPEDDDG